MKIQFRKVFFDMDDQQIAYGSYPTGYDTITKANLETEMGDHFGTILRNKGTIALSSFIKLFDFVSINEGTKPLFSIVNNNSAHHMSYILGLTCLKRGRNTKKVIINFDQHYDYDSTTPGVISCGKWGCTYLSGEKPTGQECIYMVIGVKKCFGIEEHGVYNKACYVKNGARNENYYIQQYSNKPGKKIESKIFKDAIKSKCSTAFLRATLMWTSLMECGYVDLTGKLNALKEYKKENMTVLNEKESDLNLTEAESQAIVNIFSQNAVTYKNIDGTDLVTNILLDIETVFKKLKNITTTDYSLNDVDVYLTVDRDIMKGSCTTYGDGVLTVEDARNAIKGCLTYLNGKGACLLGFDITGLPVADEGPGTNEGKVAQAKEDINQFFTAASDYNVPEEPVAVTTSVISASSSAI